MSILKDIIAPVVGTAILGGPGGLVAKGLGALAPSLASNSLVTNALTGAIVSGLTGGSPLKGALTGGLGGAFNFTGQDQQQSSGQNNIPKPTTPTVSTSTEKKGGSFLGPLLRGLGLDEDSTFYKVANTPVGAALLTGGIAQLLAGDDDDDPLPAQDFRKFGSAAGFESIPLIDFSKQGSVLTANRGGTIFPRRDGAIMPYEGGGSVDDVPAMLTAGEFVLTKDAVKGLGGGDQNKGIQRAYDMMSNLERMA